MITLDTISNKDKMVQTFEGANKLLNDISNSINDNQKEYLKETIKTKAIPPPRLTIKDHKTPNKIETLR